MRSKRRVTKMVVIVVLIFAVCWLPIQIVQLNLFFGTYPETMAMAAAQIASNCIAYMNSCVNPFLYAFLSDNFRKSFRRLLCCYSNFQPVKLHIEKTTTGGDRLENITRSTGLWTTMTMASAYDGQTSGVRSLGPEAIGHTLNKPLVSYRQYWLSVALYTVINLNGILKTTTITTTQP